VSLGDWKNSSIIIVIRPALSLPRCAATLRCGGGYAHKWPTIILLSPARFLVCPIDKSTMTSLRTLSWSPLTTFPKTIDIPRTPHCKVHDALAGRTDNDALASALVKISRIAEEVPNDTAETHPATAPLFIVNPLSGRGMDNLFSTHPSTENRVAALEKLSREMGLGGFGAAAPAGDTRLRGPWA
jgi:hypothetical protein